MATATTTLYQLACNCNRRGIPHPEAENLITSNFYHENQTEIRKSIESAFQNNAAEFGKFANLAGSQKKEIVNDTTRRLFQNNAYHSNRSHQFNARFIPRRCKSF
jgi:aspartate carbamoyltransferase catalytic subunit